MGGLRHTEEQSPKVFKRAFMGRGVPSGMLGSKHGEDEVLMAEQGERPGTGLLEPKQGEKDVPVEEQLHVRCQSLRGRKSLEIRYWLTQGN